ncbi:unnamed protein product [Paramecium sonneborni]|uniref:Transmembrane protein n=1 Tax=Paramecium sonneborni TaxID=65129 RepID=A0A8S1RB43_9CILI|nr:unnamed protein product [Paramecium sonneborni]
MENGNIVQYSFYQATLVIYQALQFILIIQLQEVMGLYLELLYSMALLLFNRNKWDNTRSQQQGYIFQYFALILFPLYLQIKQILHAFLEAFSQLYLWESIFKLFHLIEETIYHMELCYQNQFIQSLVQS